MTTLDRTLPLPLAAPRTGAALALTLHLLRRLERGALELHLPGGRVERFGPGGPACERGSPAAAVLAFRDTKVAADVLRGGDVAFGEAYMDGRIETPDLVQLLTVLAANQRSLEPAFYGRAWMRTLLRLRHAWRANSRRQARRNILAHYDLGNAFYALWLDPTMSYSSAWFDGDPGRDLASAQQAKYDRVLRELALPEGASVLEIGAGWGGFARTAARAGHRVLGVSLSEAQTAFACERLRAEGLDRLASIAIQDYRDVRGRFDGVASIEMFEAVGERWWPAWFRTVHDALVPGGRACVQTITIADDRFDRYRTQSDFIQQHVFPGGMLASPSRFLALARDAGLREVRTKTFGLDYAQTLKRWLAAFDARAEDVRAQGFPERFVRGWRFYLAYCAAGFDTRTIDVGHYTLQRG